MTLVDDSELKERIRKAALLNAVAHDGKAQPGAIVGKILGEKVELRSRVKELSNVISKVVEEVNNLSLIATAKNNKNTGGISCVTP